MSLQSHLEDVPFFVQNFYPCHQPVGAAPTVSPSIPQGNGLEFALPQAIPTSPPSSTAIPIKSMLRNLLRHILKPNVFSFNRRCYWEDQGEGGGGRGMGTICERWTDTQPHLWLRFIDDILLVMPYSPDKVQELVAHLNNKMCSIKNTQQQSQTAPVTS